MATANKSQTQQTANTNHAGAESPIKSAKIIEAGGMRFRRKAVVTVPVLKLKPDLPAYVRIESAMEISKQIDSKTAADAEVKAGGDKGGKKKMEPATIAHCVDMTTGEECIIIVGKVLEGVLREQYPNNGYVGKCFEIINRGKIGDKAYNTYSVVEVEPEE